MKRASGQGQTRSHSVSMGSKRRMEEVPPCTEFRIVVRPSGRLFRRWESFVEKSEKEFDYWSIDRSSRYVHYWRSGNLLRAFTEDGAFDKAAAAVGKEQAKREREAEAQRKAEREARRQKALTRTVSVV